MQVVQPIADEVEAERVEIVPAGSAFCQIVGDHLRCPAPDGS